MKECKYIDMKPKGPYSLDMGTDEEKNEEDDAWEIDAVEHRRKLSKGKGKLRGARQEITKFIDIGRKRPQRTHGLKAPKTAQEMEKVGWHISPRKTIAQQRQRKREDVRVEKRQH